MIFEEVGLLQGIIFNLIILSIIIILSFKNPKITQILIVAYFLRIFSVYINIFIQSLPDSQSDALVFQEIAMSFAKNDIYDLLKSFTGPDTYFISWFYAIFIVLFDESLLLLHSLSVFFGVGTVFLLWLLTKELWGEKAANISAWIAAFFPSLILYSAITMRESFLTFFLIMACFGLVKTMKTYKLKYILLSLFSFYIGSFFHGTMIFGAVFLSIVIIINAYKRFNFGLKERRLNPTFILLSILIIISVPSVISLFSNLPKIGIIFSSVSLENLLEIIMQRFESNYRQDATFSYPDWLTQSDPLTWIILSPIRLIYFFFGPFIWDISNLYGLIFLFDGILYFFVFLRIYLRRKDIFINKPALAILILGLAFSMIFALSISNFGSGFRHRAKFLCIFLALLGVAYQKKQFENKSLHLY